MNLLCFQIGSDESDKFQVCIETDGRDQASIPFSSRRRENAVSAASACVPCTSVYGGMSHLLAPPHKPQFNSGADLANSQNVG